MFVVFLDMLGFASKINALSDDEQEALISAIMWNVHDVDRKSLTDNSWALFREYRTFHEILQEKVQDAQELINISHGKNGAIASSIMFSDSAFIAFNNIDILVSFVDSFMGTAYNKYIPIRGGISSGSFARFAFSTIDYPNGNFSVQCPFMGSAVVRSYQAESCGLKGLRVFVHPTIAQEIEKIEPMAIQPLPIEEVNTNASHEIVLGWRLAARFGKDACKGYLHAINTMKPKSNDGAIIQYTTTEAALYRMRDKLGFAGNELQEFYEL